MGEQDRTYSFTTESAAALEISTRTTSLLVIHSFASFAHNHARHTRAGRVIQDVFGGVLELVTGFLNWYHCPKSSHDRCATL